MLSLNAAVNATIKTHMYITSAVDRTVRIFSEPKCSLCKGIKKDNTGSKTSFHTTDVVCAIEPGLCRSCVCKFSLFFTRGKWRDIGRDRPAWEGRLISDARHIDVVEWIAHLVRLNKKPKWLLEGHPLQVKNDKRYTKGK